MIKISKIKKIGLGFGFGGAFSKEVRFTNQHKKALNFFLKIEKGNFVDTAINYANGESEKIIGKLDKKVKEKIFISTKVPAENLNYENFINSCLQSLKNLKISKLDLIQPHWPNYNIDNNELINAYLYLKKRKKVRYFGLSNFDLKNIKFFKNKLKNDFKFIQDEFSLRDNEIEHKIKFCEKNNIKIICYSPFGSGQTAFSSKEKKILNDFSRKYKKPISSIILNYLSSRSKNIILIPHTKNIFHLEENMMASKFKMKKKDILKLANYFKPQYKYLKLKDIVFFNVRYTKIQSLDDALNNKNNLNPSPKIIAERLKKGHKLKSIKLIKIGKKFHIKEGRTRYWSHVIAYGWNKRVKMIVS